VKNIGDSLLFYFPISSQTEEKILQQTIDCCLAISIAHKKISEQLKNSNLPEIDFRTSATYGMVSVAKMKTSSINDIFGETVNRCAKINHSALPNTLVIDSSLYQKVKELESFSFTERKENTMSNKSDYKVYLIRK